MFLASIPFSILYFITISNILNNIEVALKGLSSSMELPVGVGVPF